MGCYLFTLCSLTSFDNRIGNLQINQSVSNTWEKSVITIWECFHFCMVFLHNSQIGHICCIMLLLSGDAEWGKQRNPGSPMSVNESERGCLCNCGIYNWTVNSLAQVTFLLVRTSRLKKGQSGSWGGMMEVKPSLWPHCTGELVETE